MTALEIVRFVHVYDGVFIVDDAHAFVYMYVNNNFTL